MCGKLCCKPLVNVIVPMLSLSQQLPQQLSATGKRTIQGDVAALQPLKVPVAAAVGAADRLHHNAELSRGFHVARRWGVEHE